MKKIFTNLTLVIAFFLVMNAEAQIVNIPDSTFKAYLLADTLINTNHDTEIQVSEAAAFTGEISISFLNISDLTGLEAFTSITGLDCSYNSLNNIDLTHNTALQYLNCASSTVSNLNVSNNTALTYIQCEVNSISSLDLSLDTALHYLECELNSISSLDVTHNTHLDTFFCFNNLISNLDLHLNPNLSAFDCSHNSLSSLDLHLNPNLSYFTCSHNLLSSLDLHLNMNLNTLACNKNSLNILDLHLDTALSSLICDSNSINSLILPLHCNLNYLLCENNSLGSLDLHLDTALRHLFCENNSLNLLNIANGNNIFMSFNASHNPNLTCVTVDNVTWADTNWAFTIDSIASFSLNCACNQIVNIPDSVFKAYLIGNPNINTNLDSEITVCEAAAFSGGISISGIYSLTGIEAFTSLTSLSCYGNPQLTSLDISHNTSLTWLDCSYNTHLSYLNAANGNNINFTGFNALNDPLITCIQVDNVAWSTANWTLIDNTASFGLNCPLITGLMSSSNESEGISIYPNPASSTITIHQLFPSPNQQLLITNILGEEIYHQSINNSTQTTIDISQWSNGVYFYQIRNDKETLQGKFVKQ
jgi:Leucine-rich repeat (LRR) protein